MAKKLYSGIMCMRCRWIKVLFRVVLLFEHHFLIQNLSFDDHSIYTEAFIVRTLALAQQLHENKFNGESFQWRQLCHSQNCRSFFISIPHYKL